MRRRLLLGLCLFASSIAKAAEENSSHTCMGGICLNTETEMLDDFYTKIIKIGELEWQRTVQVCAGRIVNIEVATVWYTKFANPQFKSTLTGMTISPLAYKEYLNFDIIYIDVATLAFGIDVLMKDRGLSRDRSDLFVSKCAKLSKCSVTVYHSPADNVGAKSAVGGISHTVILEPKTNSAGDVEGSAIMIIRTSLPDSKTVCAKTRIDGLL